jgi:ADP-L-glycero-D-manno-heptose 6-epimerase
MLLVTGGAGFIGSNMVASLNEAGRSDIVVNDLLGSDGKWRNLQKRQIADFIPPSDLMAWLSGRKLEAVIHLGAISSTTASDGDAVMENNFRLSLKLLDWCTAAKVPFIYASSAATYGDGEQGFTDNWQLPELRKLKPMNLYGWSKHLFDLALIDRASKGQNLPPQWAGLKFFNVFGPNEYHKGDMMSLVAKNYARVAAGEAVRLFKSHRPDYRDGEQLRDFVYVKDCAEVMLWFWRQHASADQLSGIYNLGTGKARSFLDLIKAVGAAYDRAPEIEYVAMPETIRPNYQYFTEAAMSRLRRVGYNAPFTALEDAVADYVGNHLATPDPHL